MGDLISVIVPVFNSELYLAECIESLICQSYENIEIILVDDGSKDRSYDICEQYVLMDRRIKVIRQENAGNTSARKKGLSFAEGDYVAFVDSDDWVDREFCNGLYQLACKYNAELVVSGCVKEYLDHAIPLKNNVKEGFYSKEKMEKQVYPYILLQDRDGDFGILQYMWNKLYKRQLIMNCLNRLDERIYNGEDVACILDVCLNANNMIVDNNVWYHYRIRENSLCTSSVDESYFVNAVYLYTYIKKVIEGREDVLEHQIKRVVARFVNNGTARLFGFSYSYRYGNWELPKRVDYTGKRIALFGSGIIGRAYCMQLCDIYITQDIQIFDNKFYGKNLYGFEIQHPRLIKSENFDYVIIAARNANTIQQICEELNDLGIEEDKIILFEPRRSLEGFELRV